MVAHLDHFLPAVTHCRVEGRSFLSVWGILLPHFDLFDSSCTATSRARVASVGNAPWQIIANQCAIAYFVRGYCNIFVT